MSAVLAALKAEEFPQRERASSRMRSGTARRPAVKTSGNKINERNYLPLQSESQVLGSFKSYAKFELTAL